MSSRKVMIICLITESIKMISSYKIDYHPKLYNHNKIKTKVELDLSNEATRSI